MNVYPEQLSRDRCIASILGALSLAVLVGCGRSSDRNAAGTAAAPTVVTALGRVVAGRSVISVAASPGERLQSLLVREHDMVATAAELAHLATYDVRKAELAEARTGLEQARARLKVEADLAEAQLTQAREGVRLAQLAYEHECAELKRVESLRSAEAVPGHSADNQAFLVKTRELELSRAQAEVVAATASLARVQSLVGVEAAAARVATAEAMLELSIIRAPIAGEVLRIMTYPGESIGNQPILQLGNTVDMNVVAEVHEMDIRRIRVGQHAVITSDALVAPIEGVVFEVGRLIYRNDVFDVDPRANTDTRVVEVRIKVSRPETVAGLSNLEVHVRIELGAPGG